MNTQVLPGRLTIATAESGFFKGYNHTVTLGSMLLISAFVLWAALLPEQASAVVANVQGQVLDTFGSYYIYLMALFAVVCFLLAIPPRIGGIRLGGADAKPAFSWFSWISMMYCAVIGVGMLTYATGEPIYHFANNPEVIKGIVQAKMPETLDSVYRYSFLHWGFSAWTLYALIGLSLAYFSYNMGLPLTILSALYPLFGKTMNGPLGHLVDIAAVVSALLGIAVTIGLGISQLASGMYNISGAEWIMSAGKPTGLALAFSLAVVMLLSTASAISGVGRGVKWLSNINMSLGFVLLIFFLVFGSTLFALKLLGSGLVDYLISFIPLAFNVEDKGTALGDWQGGWTVFYWAWWIASAPFVGMFFARISKGRTIREFILGAVLLPSLVCFIWLTFVGGTALDLELSGAANGQILNADISAQIYQVLNVMNSASVAKAMSALVVALLLIFLVTSADSAILIINNINTGGSTGKSNNNHTIIWGVFLTAIIAVLLVVGGMGALKAAMIIGTLPFSFILLLMTIALVKSLIDPKKPTLT
jgi:choline/carnitine/betaine transport